MEVFTWLNEHKDELLTIITSIVTLASLIVRLTPTLADDNKMLPMVKWLSKYVAINTPTPKSRPE